MTTKQLIIIALVIGIIGAIFFGVSGGFSPASAPTAAQVAPPTPEVLAQLAESKGFQHLVSIDDRGFQPARLTLQKGETVRFTNNASHEVRIRSGDTVSPPLKQGSFWEHTFDAKGAIEYADTLNTRFSGTITVQ